MARIVSGKLLQDIRLNADGKEDNGGRLYLRGAFVTVDESLREKVDTKARPAPRERIFADKQAGPGDNKLVKELQKQVAELTTQVAALQAQLKK